VVGSGKMVRLHCPKIAFGEANRDSPKCCCDAVRMISVFLLQIVRE
jgi:hypothetical protein